MSDLMSAILKAREESLSDSQVRAVIFDIDNTLYCYDDAHKIAFAKVTEYVQDNLGIDPASFLSLHKASMQQMKDNMGEVAAIHSRIIRYANILEELGMSLHPHALAMSKLYWDTLIEVSKPSPGAVELFKSLKEKGIRIGIGSDMTTEIQYEKLTSLGLMEYIDFMVTSEEAVAEKPDVKVFELCLKKAGCKPHECIFVGDHLIKDAEGANHAGMRGLWYVPEGRDESIETEQITNLLQVLDYIV